MSIESTALEFEGYEVNELVYQKNIEYEHSSDKKQIMLFPKLVRNIKKMPNNKFEVHLGVVVSADKDGNDIPFYLSVNISGFFNLLGEETDETFINQNALAILFPYLRSLVTTVTVNAGIPPIILPAVNIIQMLEEIPNDQESEI